jgi:hypothetical protein
MFEALDETVCQVEEIGRTARWRMLVSNCAEIARLTQQNTQIVRAADDHGDWRVAGCASSAEWYARASQSDFRAAARVTDTAEALRRLPALDEAMSSGVLSLDQVAAAAEFATPDTDAELARVAVGQAPSAIGRVARKLVPPLVADDEALYARRSLRMTWTRGRRELAISGRLPLEHGVIFEQAIWDIAKAQRAADKKDGVVLDWQQSAADALVTLARHGRADSGGVRRSPTALILHVSDDEAPFLEGGGPISTETAERLACDARRLTTKLKGRDLVHSRVERCASYAQLRALHKRCDHCQYPGCTAARELEAHHIVADACGGPTVLANLILLCHRHHKLLHDRHIHTSGTGDQPVFTTEDGRAITTARGP